MGTGKIILIIALIIAAIAALVAAVIIWRSSESDDPDGEEPKVKIEKITSVESFVLRLSGMRGSREYEIACDGDTATVSFYYIKYSSGEEERELDESATLGTAEMLEKLNSFGIGKWNGFVGNHPKGVTDGTQFTLEASVNGGARIYAHGSQNFPSHYHDLVDWLGELLRG